MKRGRQAGGNLHRSATFCLPASYDWHLKKRFKRFFRREKEGLDEANRMPVANKAQDLRLRACERFDNRTKNEQNQECALAGKGKIYKN